MDMVNFFYELAKEHRRVRGFAWARSHNKGSGKDMYPLVWVDDPVMGTSIGLQQRGNGIQYTVNVDFLGLAKNAREKLDVQTEAFYTGLDFFERGKTLYKTHRIRLTAFNFITLSEYYDDNAAGCRFTFTAIGDNVVDRCADNFDPDKHLVDRPSRLPDFLTENPDGCAVFANAVTLPNFKTR